jgi:uncharacterized protein (TIGR02594 family)
MEIPGERANKRILEYLRTCGISGDNDEIHWCSAYINWCVIKAGYKGTNSLLARSWLKRGTILTKPRLGCIVIFERGKPWQGHGGFYLDKNNDVIFTLGGNQSDRVGVNGYLERRVVGYRSVA